MAYFYIGVICILAGYNNYSYVKGISNKAQRNFIFFSLAIIILMIFNIIIDYNCAECVDCP